MESVISSIGLTPEHVAYAERPDYELGLSKVFHAELFTYGQAKPLQVDFHQGFEVGIILEGKINRQFENLSFDAGPGEVWLCAMWEPHGWAILDAGITLVLILFLPEFLGDENFEGLSWLSMFSVPPRERPRVASDELKKTILHIGKELAEEITTKPCAWTEAVRLNLLKIFLLLRRTWNPMSQQKRELRTSNLSLIIPALECIHSDPTKLVRVSEAANKCGLSNTSFSRKFQQAIGITFRRYQLCTKLGVVAQRLISTNLTLENIAEEAGFFNASHLINMFTKYYACTPAQYRRKAHSPTQRSLR